MHLGGPVCPSPEAVFVAAAQETFLELGALVVHRPALLAPTGLEHRRCPGQPPHPQVTAAQIATETHPHVSEKGDYLLILELLSERPPEVWHLY